METSALLNVIAGTAAIVGLILNILVVVIGGVWAVSKVRTTTEVLRATIDALTSAIEKVGRTVEKIDERVNQHETAIAVMQHKMEKR